MSRRYAFLAVGTLLFVTGVSLVLYIREELSAICPIGGETASEAAYCLTYQNYYMALLLTGLVAVMVGIAFLVLGAFQTKKVDSIPSKLQFT